MLYSELQCSEAIHKAVERMGFAEMTEIQEKTIPLMLAGHDVIAKAPTGTGKTCASVSRWWSISSRKTNTRRPSSWHPPGSLPNRSPRN